VAFLGHFVGGRRSVAKTSVMLVYCEVNREPTRHESCCAGLMRRRAVLTSIHIGKPASYGSEDAIDPHDKPWTTGFYKTPVEGPVFAGTTNLAGDGQADLENHGGVDKAVLATTRRIWRSRVSSLACHGWQIPGLKNCGSVPSASRSERLRPAGGGSSRRHEDTKNRNDSRESS